MIYKWKQGSRLDISAQVAGEELERIRVRNNGRLESAMVVEAARDESSPLYPAFEWDDQKAAHNFRVGQAGYIIRSVEVEVEQSQRSEPIRAFVSVVRDEDRSYTSVSHALADPALRQQVLQSALRDLVAWRDRYAELTELAQVFAAIDEAQGTK